MKTTKQKSSNRAAIALGRLGGNKTAKRGKAYYKRIGKLGSNKRWAIKKAKVKK